MKKLILERIHKITALVLLLFGIIALVMAKGLKFGSFSKPNAGFLPTISSVVLIVFAALNLFLECRKPNSIPEELKDVNWIKWALYMGICVVFVFMVKKIGFILDTVICLFAMLKVAGVKRWIKPALISIIFSFTIWLLFNYVMHVRLPAASWL